MIALGGRIRDEDPRARFPAPAWKLSSPHGSPRVPTLSSFSCAPEPFSAARPADRQTCLTLRACVPSQMTSTWAIEWTQHQVWYNRGPWQTWRRAYHHCIIFSLRCCPRDPRSRVGAAMAQTGLRHRLGSSPRVLVPVGRLPRSPSLAIAALGTLLCLFTAHNRGFVSRACCYCSTIVP